MNNTNTDYMQVAQNRFGPYTTDYFKYPNVAN